MYGLITLPIVPMRAIGNERSEMITQLLFGEFLKVIEENENWCLVMNVADNYVGWINRKMIHPVSDDAFFTAQEMDIIRLPRTYSIIFDMNRNQTMLLPGGSLIYNLTDNDFKNGDDAWSLIEPVSRVEKFAAAYQLIEIASQYMNAPYLWGGKSILGIDCSGLVQVVFAIGGYLLPRDASQQVDKGKVVDFLTEALPGDLAFFENKEGNISHVGILIDSTKIIHASGWVKVENIDSQGIISTSSGEYTHRLRVIKRIINFV